MTELLDRTADPQQESPAELQARIDAASESAKRFGEMDPHRRAVGADITKILSEMNVPMLYGGPDAVRASQEAEAAARAARLNAVLPPQH